jgi:hypothetical protein
LSFGESLAKGGANGRSGVDKYALDVSVVIVMYDKSWLLVAVVI